MTKKSGFNFQTGQVLLITVLVMIVGLTVSLAVVARSLTSVKISTQEEESQRAFYAAEAGLEEKLLPGANQGSGSIGNASYIVTFTQNPLTEFKFPDILNKDETQSLWLSAHNENDEIAPANENNDYKLTNDLDICWNGSEPAMEMTFIYETKAPKAYRLARAAYDPNGVRGNTNYFSDVTDSGGDNCDGTYTYKQTINFASIFAPINIPDIQRVIAIRLKPIYASAEVFVMGIGDELPAQQKEIESLGSAGTAQRKLKVFRAYPSLLPIFDFVLFSGTSLTK